MPKVVNLKDIASDLNSFLEETVKPSSPRSIVTEDDYAALGRATVNYVLSQVDGGDSPEVIGEAMVIGAQAAAQDSKVGADETVEAAVRVIERMAESMRRMQ